MPEQEKFLSDQDRADALRSLSEKLEHLRTAPSPGTDDNASGWAIGVRYASEFSASVIVGALFGVGVDYFADSRPWGLIVGLILGFMAGTRSIVRTARELSEQDGESPTD